MASIKMGAMVTAIAGKVGGTVFRRGRTGQIMSNIPVVRHTTNLTVSCLYIPLWGWRCCFMSGMGWPVCSNFFVEGYDRAANNGVASASAKWKTLTTDQQNTWFTGTSSFPRTNKFGDTYTPSAFQLFCELNGNLLNAQAEMLTECPTPTTLSTDYNPEFGTNSNNITNVGLAISLRDNEYIQIMSSGSFGLGRKKSAGGFKLITYLNVQNITVFDITEQMQDRFPFNPLGAKVGFKWRVISTLTGQASAWQYATYKTVEGVEMTGTCTLTVTGTGGTCQANVTTISSGCTTAQLFKVADYPENMEPVLDVSLTPNTTTVSVIPLMNDTLAVLVITDSNGFQRFISAFAKYVP